MKKKPIVNEQRDGLGCKNVFFVDSKTGEGVAELFSYLKEENDVLPWETKQKQNTNQTKNIKKTTKTT